MTPSLFTSLFLAVLLLTTLLKLWLARRHLVHIAAHRSEVPVAFSEKIELPAHQKAADYTTAKIRLAVAELFLEPVTLLIFTLGGGIQWLAGLWLNTFDSPIAQGIALIASVLLISGALELPFGLYKTFVIEARFGFNKMTLALYIADIFKGLLLGALFGLPLLAGVLWLMERMGANWWLYVWGVWVAFNLLLLFIYPTFIAPLFNKFQPLQDESLKTRIEALLAKCGFTSSGLFVMDGSKRSSHGNAYFTGFGKTKRIVSSFALSLAFLWLLAQLIGASWFYAGLGVTTHTTAIALLLFFLALPVFSFPLHPLTSAWSRKHEFEADAYAAQQADARDLSSALVKMYQDNAATLTPDPLYSMFYDTHPPAPARIARLQSLQGA